MPTQRPCSLFFLPILSTWTHVCHRQQSQSICWALFIKHKMETVSLASYLHAEVTESGSHTRGPAERAVREAALHPSDQSFSQGQCFNPYYLSSLLNSLFKVNITSESCASLSDFYPSSFFHLHLSTFKESNQGCSWLCLGYWGWKEPSAPWDLSMKQAGAQPFVPSLLSGPGSLHPGGSEGSKH